MTATVPPDQEELTERVTRLIESNDPRGALLACQSLNQACPGHAYGWYLASFLMKRGRNYGDALKTIDRALELGYEHKYQLHKAKCLFESGDVAGAIAAARLIQDKSFGDPLLHNELGSLLYRLEDHAGALAQYSRAIELDANNAEFHFNKAAVQRYLGDVAGAEAGFNAAIALKPDEYEAYNGRAQLRTQTRESNHIEELKAVVARTRASAGLVQLNFALAKEQEDLGDFDDAFASLKQGADLKRRHMQYRVETDLEIIAKIREVFGAQVFAEPVPGCPSADPIFIIGMPRTGTTLVERILGSHPSVFSAGELNHFSLELIRQLSTVQGARHFTRSGARHFTRLGFVEASAGCDWRALGEAYLKSTRPSRDGRPHFIDKLPFNFLYAGLIHRALPNAKIINVQRHPMDTCYAVYKQLFKDAYPFSYDLDDLGRYYIVYDGLMRHWNTVLPGVIHTLHYEALVADVEGESRRMLAYCGLPWDAQCLRFHEKPEASTTASALQVRQPIYDTSVGKWRRYAKQLAPLRANLERAGIRIE